MLLEDELLHGNYEDVVTPTDEQIPVMDMTHDLKDNNSDKPLVSHHKHIDLGPTNSICPFSLNSSNHAISQSINGPYCPNPSQTGAKMDLGIQTRLLNLSFNGGGTKTTFSDVISLERGRRAAAREVGPGILGHPLTTQTELFKGPASSSLLKVSQRISKDKECKADDNEDGEEDGKEDGKEDLEENEMDLKVGAEYSNAENHIL
ncbi:hypothetical protein DFH28DRAFT_923212 [Melampsora americana]|nr:hypothetical protein DFH28DRAFT_923212 [Melampsora americana]